MKRILTTLIILTVIIKIFAQNDYQHGYILFKDNSKVTGWINLKNNEANSKLCYFKKDSLGEPKIYKPQDLKAYRIDNSKFFISKIVNRRQDTIFLECLISGINSLYYREKDSKPYYYVEHQDSITEINNDEYITTNNYGDKYLKNTHQYIGILKYYFRDSPEIAKKVETTKYDKPSLINLTKTYHEKVCQDQQCIVYEKAKVKRVFYKGIEFALFYGSLNFQADRVRFQSGSKISPDISVFVETNIDENKHFLLKVTAGYKNYKYTDSKIILPYYSQTGTINYNFSTVYLSPSIKYILIFGKVAPFLSISVPAGTILNDKGTYSQPIPDINSIPNRTFTTNGFYDGDQDKMIFGFNIGLGLEIKVANKRFITSIDYENLYSPAIASQGLKFKCGYKF